MKISFVQDAPSPEAAIILFVGSDKKLVGPAADLDQASGGAIARALDASPRFHGKAEDVLSVPGVAGIGGRRAVLVGVGDAATIDALALQRVGGAIAAHLNQVGESAAVVRAEGLAGPAAPSFAAAELAVGARLRAYRFDKYRTREKPEAKPTLAELTIVVGDAASAAERYATAESVAKGVFLARDLLSEPANVLYPESFADRCLELSELGLDVEVIGAARLRDLGFGALLAVGQGSARESRVAVMRWQGAPRRDDPPIAFVGKGVTFDTGGISLKPAAGMEDMKWDMGGAAAVTGAMAALAGRRARVNAVGVVGLVENMPSATAQRPGDVITSLSGQTIEVINTDAEGRLVLADAMTYTISTFRPKAIIDLATLTGAIMVALGHHNAGLYSTDDTLADGLVASGKAVGETVWRMPLDDIYDKDIESQIADVRNVAGSRYGGSVVAAKFLQRFVDDTPWAHLDIAGMVWSTKDSSLAPKGGTGYGVRLLDRLVADHYESD